MKQTQARNLGGAMSKLNGDKARFNRVRKQNIRRRERIRKFREALGKRDSGIKSSTGM
jgi:hypothetical protein